MKGLIKILCCLFFFIGLNITVISQTFQNVVPNGSFETYTQCPNTASQIYFSPPWSGPRTNSTDYNNTCSSLMNVPYYGGIGSFYPYYLNAKHGNAYAGIFVYGPQNYREYLQVSLTDTLKAQACYYIEFFSALCQITKFGTNNVAGAFSNSFIPVNGVTAIINYTSVLGNITNYNNPRLKDTVFWEKISGLYEADGSEKFFLIGNFKDNTATDTTRLYPFGSTPNKAADNSYVFVDAVSVFSINPSGKLPWNYRDTSIIKGDSVYIGTKTGGKNFHPKWYDMSGNYLATNAGIYVRPIITTSYVVQYTICGVQRADTVEVKVLPDVGIRELKTLNEELKIYPVPAQDEINLIVENQKLFKDFNRIEILNSLGEIIREEEIVFKDKKAIVQTGELSNGVYFITLSNSTNEKITKKLLIAR